MDMPFLQKSCAIFHILDKGTFIKKMEFSIQAPLPTKKACQLYAGLQSQDILGDKSGDIPNHGVFITLNRPTDDYGENWTLGTSWYDQAKGTDTDGINELDSINVPPNGIVQGTIEYSSENDTWSLTRSYAEQGPLTTEYKITGDPKEWMKTVMGAMACCDPVSAEECKESYPSDFNAIFTIISLTLDDGTSLNFHDDLWDFWQFNVAKGTDKFQHCLAYNTRFPAQRKGNLVELSIIRR